MLTNLSSTDTQYRVAKGKQRLHSRADQSLLASSRKSARKGKEYIRNYLILNNFIEWIKKVGADNKPGSVIDNHSSGTAVTDCL